MGGYRNGSCGHFLMDDLQVRRKRQRRRREELLEERVEKLRSTFCKLKML